LVELLIVIAIMLLLSGVVAVNLMQRRDVSEVRVQRIQIDQISDALEQFRLDMRRYPTVDEGLAVLWDKELIEEEAMEWSGPYLNDPVAKDQWGNEYEYIYPGELRSEKHFDLRSFGPDGEVDTEDDITNHDRIKDSEGEIDESYEDFDEALGAGEEM
tara:strand:+ start:170 stop:643 length:474 start_codon:yes stop_codon:yes gene_type:complete